MSEHGAPHAGEPAPDADVHTRSCGYPQPDERDPSAVTAARAAQDAAARHEARRPVERSRVEVVRAYADTTDCRRRLLLELLGEPHPRPCGACDTCDAGTSVAVRDAPVHPGQAVEHAEFGPGQVSVVEDDRVTVFFADRGYVTLDTAVAWESGLLRAAG